MASDSKHVMLSYQWDHQPVVKSVFDGLTGLGIPTWMDIEGGMKTNVNDSMAFGVDNAAVICCFMSPKYLESKNCKKELNYADGVNVPIVPVMLERNWKATQWLGLITAGLLWIDFRSMDNIETRIQSLAKEIVYRAGSDLVLKSQRPKTAGKKTVDLEKKSGRAFRHKNTNKYLAESGVKKSHDASGVRNNLVLCDQPEATSYWIEEQQQKGSEIYFYKNYETGLYLGYDPDGDYIYTKGSRWGAEEWVLKADDTDNTGERSVVIYANYGKKYLAVTEGGTLTGVNSISDDCIWILG